MNTNFILKLLPHFVLALAMMVGTASGATVPTRVSSAALNINPYFASGVVMNTEWRGSGTVVRHPKIVATCAHLEFESGTWLLGFTFSNRYHNAYMPGPENSKDLRGYWYWTNYSGGTSGTAFNYDFVVHYAYQALAGNGYAGWIYNNSTIYHPLNGSLLKRIVGYPASDGYYMNMTGNFGSAYRAKSGRYFWDPYVKGGPGMSGGGVFVYSNGWKFAGVHVSGSADGSMGAGARALDSAAFNLMTNAIRSSEAVPSSTTTQTFANSNSVRTPDAESAWTVQTINVSGMPENTTSVKFSMHMTHAYVGDLEVMVTSPAGRTLLVQSRSGGSQRDLVINNSDVTGSFSGSNPNGAWKVSVRDLAAGDEGTLDSSSFTIAAR